VLIAPSSPSCDERRRANHRRTPHDAMLTVLPTLYPAAAARAGVHPTARIGRGATLGQDVTIGRTPSSATVPRW
jgi:UDP-3-O-[3-hydroxymyristoyl] glucosamine N-acyltransferase